ncbi:MAG: zinc ribbon domain-containing protein [Anaerolineaceae bacterium]|nr:MAG: zinc ribbon domain-containing protein [Anaerolineaceae bacterium]
MVEVPAIIGEDLFEKVKERMGKNKRQMGKNRKRVYLLGGMVRCGDCGRSATAFTMTKGGKEYSYYRCSTWTMAKRTRPKCNLMLNVEATLIENDKGRFVDALCILGQKKLSTDQHKRRYMT